MLFDWFKKFRGRLVLPALLGIAAVTALAFGVYQYQLRANYEAQLKNMYTRSFYELVDSMDNVQVQLSKLMVSNSPGGNVQLLSSITQQASNAAEKISQLPLTHPALSNTMGLISLTGDYCRSLANKAADGHPLTAEDIEHLKSLYSSCQSVMDELRNMQNAGAVNFGNINNKTYYDVASSDKMSTQFSQQDKSGTGYPTLIYDGPFSESVASATAKGLPASQVDDAGAKAAAAAFLGLPNVNSVTVTGTGKGTIQTYLIEALNLSNRKVTMQVTMQGGKVLQMIEDSGQAQPKLSADDCAKKAADWLSARGFPNMVSTFRQQYDGLLVVNFAPMQDSAVLYTDLVKVKIRMDDGNIAGFDATNYWMNHTDRPTLVPKLRQADAQKLVSTQLQVDGSLLALTPMSGGGERLCWEFRGTFGGDTFYVYIDAVTGEEAGIFKVIKTDAGSLVM